MDQKFSQSSASGKKKKKKKKQKKKTAKKCAKNKGVRTCSALRAVAVKGVICEYGCRCGTIGVVD